MPEQQNIVYKQSWHHDFLNRSSLQSCKNKHFRHKWVCSFANMQGGYIDAWGRGTIKIIDTCKQAELPEPEMIELDGGFRITIFKESKIEGNVILNHRQLDAIAYFKPLNEIIISEYVKHYNIAERTARRDLFDLVKNKLILKVGDKKSTKYYFP
jgi:ATP-dependent DNA helicase RecG